MKRRNHYDREAQHRPIPICPRCGRQATETLTRHGLRADCCGLWSWQRWPLVDRETHTSRKRAHAAFDPIWQLGLVSRSRAYALLAAELGIAGELCHIKMMDKEQAHAATLAAKQIRARLEARLQRVATATEEGSP